jgi:hypothetical protein
MLALTAPAMALAAFGTIQLYSGDNLAPTTQTSGPKKPVLFADTVFPAPVIKETSDVGPKSSTDLAREHWKDGEARWADDGASTGVWYQLNTLLQNEDLKPDTTESGRDQEETWISIVLDDDIDEKIGTHFKRLEQPNDFDEKKSRLESLVADVPSSIKALFDELEKLRNHKFPALIPSQKNDKTFSLSETHFVWIERTDKTPGFWISRSEIAPGNYEKGHGDDEIKEIAKHMGALPASWVIRRPTADEWNAAHARNGTDGLEKFNGGLGEVLDDGKIIGTADEPAATPHTRSPAARQPDRNKVALEYEGVRGRKELTRVMVTPARPGFGGGNVGSSGIGPQYRYEERFATRIVIVPPP